MGRLDGRNALIFGVANDHSIAWGIARALHDEGAEVGFSSVESLIERRVRPLAESIGSTFVEACDVQSDEQIREVFTRWGETHDRLDILVHALAFARREDLEGSFVDTSRDGFALALDVSAYSLVALAREARSLLRPGSSVLTLSYYGAEKVVANYNVMGVAKAALERPSGTWPPISAPRACGSTPSVPGPIRTLAASGIAGSSGCTATSRRSRRCGRTSPPRTSAARPSISASDLSAAVTGEVLYVDGGFNILGVPTGD
jgi:enoyl-[acyl-carrier protein] reductase I